MPLGSASGSSIALSATGAPVGAYCLVDSSSSEMAMWFSWFTPRHLTSVCAIATTPDLVTLIMEQLGVVDGLRLARTSVVWRDASRELWGTCFSLVDTYVATGKFVRSDAPKSAQLDALAALSIEELMPRHGWVVIWVRRCRALYENPRTREEGLGWAQRMYRSLGMLRGVWPPDSLCDVCEGGAYVEGRTGEGTRCACGKHGRGATQPATVTVSRLRRALSFMHIGTPQARSDHSEIPSVVFPQQCPRDQMASVVWRAGRDLVYPLVLANYSEAYMHEPPPGVACRG